MNEIEELLSRVPSPKQTLHPCYRCEANEVPGCLKGRQPEISMDGVSSCTEKVSAGSIGLGTEEIIFFAIRPLNSQEREDLAARRRAIIINS
jgi:hypothetical protein